MPILDFKEIAEGNKADGHQDEFELFARDFFELLGYEIVEGPDRGPDDGRDLIISETRTGPGGTTIVRWLVSCKHNAHSGKSVGVNDELNIRDRLEQHNCQGFIGFYSTIASSGLSTKLAGMKMVAQLFDSQKIEGTLIDKENAETLVQRYFPESSIKLMHIRSRASGSMQEFTFSLPQERVDSFDRDKFLVTMAEAVNASTDELHVESVKSGSVHVTLMAPLRLCSIMVRPAMNHRLNEMGVRSWSVKILESAFLPSREPVLLYKRPPDSQEEHPILPKRPECSDFPIQSEAQLEENLVQRLIGMGYEHVSISDQQSLNNNLKKQLEKHNDVTLSDNEFSIILNHLSKGTIFDKARTVRDRFHLTRDDGSSLYIRFLNTNHWCQNEYQVTSQITNEGSYKNRYDVTILINGLPLVQIELKRRGLELKEAFNQINRYQRHSYWADNALFQYIQIFIISNGVNTKYYANNRNQSFKQTFYWTREDNELITQLDQFTDIFLEKCHISKMICRYIVMQETDKILMVLRPYQYYAVENIITHVKESNSNGYIWHTTGSGKTLTSFKASQILTGLPEVDKVVFVVDRADLDYQTTREFNTFCAGCVDSTDNTKELVKQLSGDNKLIVTTIQKLNSAIRPTSRHLNKMKELADRRIIFIFDECHRSQFGDTHKRITEFFNHYQMIGFTGTPIFADNATKNELGKRTTKDLFDERLHQYVITNAIIDENVLKFSVEYWGRLKRKDGSLIDEKVASINTKEFFENPDRIEKIVDWIIANHDRKTHNKTFSAILAVGSVDALVTYYEMFKEKKLAGKHNLRVVTIFSYTPNEEDKEANGLIGEPDFDIRSDDPVHRHSREKLDEFIRDYNETYQTRFSTKDGSFYNYYKDIGKRIKDREKQNFNEKDRVDILLVVNMFLTGFDAKKVNTLYVDKNLKFHGLIQAFSRTNRILDNVKSQGNIVCFRNLKNNTDQAISLFSNKNAKEIILVDPYEDFVKRFNNEVKTLLEIAPTVDSVNELASEDKILAFIQSFRLLIRIMNTLTSFSQFKFEDLDLREQEYEDYKSKYLDIHDRTVKNENNPASIIRDVDFELELIHRDEINVAYILNLLAELHFKNSGKDEFSQKEKDEKQKEILSLLSTETQLRSKRELVEIFIEKNMPKLGPNDDIKESFNTFWSEEKEKSFRKICKDENLTPSEVNKVLDQYRFTGRKPLPDGIVSTMKSKPKILDRKMVIERITNKLLEYLNRFEDNMGEI